jgi:hypothetical protein
MKRAGLIAILMLSAVLIGCATDPVAIDLTSYVNQGLLQIAELEQKSLERYALVTGPNSKPDEEVYAALNDQGHPSIHEIPQGPSKNQARDSGSERSPSSLHPRSQIPSGWVQNVEDCHRAEGPKPH